MGSGLRAGLSEMFLWVVPFVNRGVILPSQSSDFFEKISSSSVVLWFCGSVVARNFLAHPGLLADRGDGESWRNPVEGSAERERARSQGKPHRIPRQRWPRVQE